MARQPHNPTTDKTPETPNADDLGNPGGPAPANAPPTGPQASAQGNPLPLVRPKPVTLLGGAAGMPSQASVVANRPETRVEVGRLQQEGTPPGTVVKRFVVENGGHVMIDGYRQRIPAGKIVDNRQYDLRVLKQGGITLRELRDDDAEPGFEEGLT